MSVLPAAEAESRAQGLGPREQPLEVRTDSLGGSPLSRAAQAGTAPADWYPPLPANPAAWRERAEGLRQQFAAGAWLHLLEPAFDARSAAAERLQTVAKGAGIVVTTGQQPGLFGGPMYTWSKALGALAFADALQQATGIPTAPVFWAATDDADFAEASVTAVAGPRGAEWLRARATAPEGTPMSLVPIGDDVPPMLGALRDAAGSIAYAPALAAAESAYRAGHTAGGAYVALLRALLEPLGIAVLDASHESTREAGFHTMRRALHRAAELERALTERTEAIRAAGFTPQVDGVDGLSLVFRYDADGRKARVPVADARALVSQVRAGELGPNVLLRPVVERAILPTVAYMAGPGELTYFAQVSAVAPVIGAESALAVPRWSGTVIEPHVRRALDRLGAAPDDLAAPDVLFSRLARAQLPHDVNERLRALRTGADAQLAALAADGDALVSVGVLDGFGRALGHRVDRLERRYVAAIKRRDEQTARDLALAGGALHPLGTRQERALNALPTLARHGTALWDAMLVGARRHAESLVNGAADTPPVG